MITARFVSNVTILTIISEKHFYARKINTSVPLWSWLSVHRLSNNSAWRIENIDRKLTDKWQNRTQNSRLSQFTFTEVKIQQGRMIVIWNNWTRMHGDFFLTFSVNDAKEFTLIERIMTSPDVGGCKQSLVKFKPTATEPPWAKIYCLLVRLLFYSVRTDPGPIGIVGMQRNSAARGTKFLPWYSILQIQFRQM